MGQWIILEKKTKKKTEVYSIKRTMVLYVETKKVVYGVDVYM